MFWRKKRLNYELDQSLFLNTKIQDMSFTVFDTETTGFAIGADDRLIEIGAVHVEGLEVTDWTFQTFVNPSRQIPEHITKLTSIKQSDVDDAPSPLEAIESYFQFIEETKSSGWIGHHVSFDMMVIKKELDRAKHSYEQPSSFDTKDLLDFLYPLWEQRDLEDYSQLFGTEIFERHRALGDAQTTAHLFVELLKRLDAKGVNTLEDLVRIKNNKAKQSASHF